MKSDGMRHLYVTPTRDRLNEASFFLSKMSEGADDWDVFRFNLSAFLAAARNVTWIMQKQYADFDGFKEWLIAKQIAMNENPLMKYFKEQRNQITKQRSITSSFPVSVHLDENDPSKVCSIFFIDGTGGTSQPLRLDLVPMDKPGSVYYFNDYPKKDVLSLCKDYLREVEKIVVDWEAKFVQ